MEHLSLSEINTGLKDIEISSAHMGKNIIVHANEASTFIDRRGHGDWDFPFESWKSGNKMSVFFGRDMDDKI